MAGGQQRQKRARKPNAAAYIGYVEDDEDIGSCSTSFNVYSDLRSMSANVSGVPSGSIMKKFEQIEKFQEAQAISKKEEDVGNPLSEEELQKALSIDSNQIPVQLAPAQLTDAKPGSKTKASPYERVWDYVPAQISESEADMALGKIRYQDSQGPLDTTAEIKNVEDHLLEVELKGIDAYTREQVCEAVSGTLSAEDAFRFVEKYLLPALHRRALSVGLKGSKKVLNPCLRVPRGVSVTPAGLTLQGAAADILVDKGIPPQFQEAAEKFVAKAKDNPADFRCHAKGVGLICNAAAGFEKDQYLGEYLGEVYPPWRWCEREAAGLAVKKEVNAKSNIPIFYNMLLELPESSENSKGYDVLWVDAKHRGSLLTRASHSCDPNVYTESKPRGGRFAVSLFAKRPIHCGEEIVYDYHCRTDSKYEMEKSICLCGTRLCRGSYVSYYNTELVETMVNDKHTTAHATALLLRACEDPTVESSHMEILRRNRLEDSVLGDLPPWGKKFAALVLEFVEAEREWLIENLTGHIFVDVADKDADSPTPSKAAAAPM
eukprot:gene13943-16482_t